MGPFDNYFDQAEPEDEDLRDRESASMAIAKMLMSHRKPDGSLDESPEAVRERNRAFIGEGKWAQLEAQRKRIEGMETGLDVGTQLDQFFRPIVGGVAEGTMDIVRPVTWGMKKLGITSKADDAIVEGQKAISEWIDKSGAHSVSKALGRGVGAIAPAFLPAAGFMKLGGGMLRAAGIAEASPVVAKTLGLGLMNAFQALPSEDIKNILLQTAGGAIGGAVAGKTESKVLKSLIENPGDKLARLGAGQQARLKGIMQDALVNAATAGAITTEQLGSFDIDKILSDENFWAQTLIPTLAGSFDKSLKKMDVDPKVQDARAWWRKQHGYKPPETEIPQKESLYAQYPEVTSKIEIIEKAKKDEMIPAWRASEGKIEQYEPLIHNPLILEADEADALARQYDSIKADKKDKAGAIKLTRDMITRGHDGAIVINRDAHGNISEMTMVQYPRLDEIREGRNETSDSAGGKVGIGKYFTTSEAHAKMHYERQLADRQRRPIAQEPVFAEKVSYAEGKTPPDMRPDNLFPPKGIEGEAEKTVPEGEQPAAPGQPVPPKTAEPPAAEVAAPEASPKQGQIEPQVPEGPSRVRLTANAPESDAAPVPPDKLNGFRRKELDPEIRELIVPEAADGIVAKIRQDSPGEIDSILEIEEKMERMARASDPTQYAKNKFWKKDQYVKVNEDFESSMRQIDDPRVWELFAAKQYDNARAAMQNPQSTDSYVQLLQAEAEAAVGVSKALRSGGDVKAELDRFFNRSKTDGMLNINSRVPDIPYYDYLWSSMGVENKTQRKGEAYRAERDQGVAPKPVPKTEAGKSDLDLHHKNIADSLLDEVDRVSSNSDGRKSLKAGREKADSVISGMPDEELFGVIREVNRKMESGERKDVAVRSSSLQFLKELQHRLVQAADKVDAYWKENKGEKNPPQDIVEAQARKAQYNEYIKKVKDNMDVLGTEEGQLLKAHDPGDREFEGFSRVMEAVNHAHGNIHTRMTKFFKRSAKILVHQATPFLEKELKRLLVKNGYTDVPDQNIAGVINKWTEGALASKGRMKDFATGTSLSKALFDNLRDVAPGATDRVRKDFAAFADTTFKKIMTKKGAQLPNGVNQSAMDTYSVIDGDGHLRLDLLQKKPEYYTKGEMLRIQELAAKWDEAKERGSEAFAQARQDIMQEILRGSEPRFEFNPDTGKLQLMYGLSKPKASLDQKVASTATIAQLLNVPTAAKNIGGNDLLARISRAADYLAAKVAKTKLIKSEYKKHGGVSIEDLSFSGSEYSRLGRKFLAPKELWKTFKTDAKDRIRGVASEYKHFSKFISDKLIDSEHITADTKMTTDQIGFENKIMRKLGFTLGVLLRSPDIAYFTANYKAYMTHYLAAENGGRIPTDAEMKGASEVLQKEAIAQARQRTLMDDNRITESLSKIKNVMNFGKAFGLGDLVGLRYIKAPVNVMVRLGEFMPGTSALNVISKYIKGRNTSWDLRERIGFEQALGKSMAGAVVAGAGVAMKLAFPEMFRAMGSPVEEINKLEEEAGHQKFALNLPWLGGRSIGLGDLGAASGLFFAGVLGAERFFLAKGSEGGDAIDAIPGIGAGMLDGVYQFLMAQPTMEAMEKGFAGRTAERLGRLRGDNTSPQILSDMVSSAVMQFFPAVFRRLVLSSDVMRKTYVDMEGMTSEEKFLYAPFIQTMNSFIKYVPGLRENLPTVKDTFGNERKYTHKDDDPLISGAMFLLSPFITKRIDYSDTALQSLDLYRATGKLLKVPNALTRTPKEFTVNRKTYKMTREQAESFQRLYKQAFDMVLQKYENFRVDRNHPELAVKYTRDVDRAMSRLYKEFASQYARKLESEGVVPTQKKPEPGVDAPENVSLDFWSRRKKRWDPSYDRWPSAQQDQISD